MCYKIIDVWLMILEQSFQPQLRVESCIVLHSGRLLDLYEAPSHALECKTREEVTISEKHVSLPRYQIDHGLVFTNFTINFTVKEP